MLYMNDCLDTPINVAGYIYSLRYTLMKSNFESQKHSNDTEFLEK